MHLTTTPHYSPAPLHPSPPGSLPPLLPSTPLLLGPSLPCPPPPLSSWVPPSPAPLHPSPPGSLPPLLPSTPLLLGPSLPCSPPPLSSWVPPSPAPLNPSPPGSLPPLLPSTPLLLGPSLPSTPLLLGPSLPVPWPGWSRPCRHATHGLMTRGGRPAFSQGPSQCFLKACLPHEKSLFAFHPIKTKIVSARFWPQLLTMCAFSLRLSMSASVEKMEGVGNLVGIWHRGIPWSLNLFILIGL